MIPRTTGPPVELFQMVDLLVVWAVAGLLIWSVYVAIVTNLPNSSFRPPVPQREAIQIAHVNQSEDRRPLVGRLQL